MSQKAKTTSHLTISQRIQKCSNYSKKIQKNTLQTNSNIEREMHAGMAIINKNYKTERTIIERNMNHQKESVLRLQAMLRVSREVKMADLMDKVKGADYEVNH